MGQRSGPAYSSVLFATFSGSSRLYGGVGTKFVDFTSYTSPITSQEIQHNLRNPVGLDMKRIREYGRIAI
jgi:hypothetical protein